MDYLPWKGGDELIWFNYRGIKFAYTFKLVKGGRWQYCISLFMQQTRNPSFPFPTFMQYPSLPCNYRWPLDIVLPMRSKQNSSGPISSILFSITLEHGCRIAYMDIKTGR